MELNMGETPDSTRPGDWQCPNTECINNTGFPKFFVFGTKVNCPKCGTGKHAQRPGDWCCPNPSCVNHQNTVYGSKPACTRCGTARPPLNVRGGPQNNMMMNPGGGAYTAGMGMMNMQMNRMPSGKGGGRPGDWHCANPSCKNHTENVVFANKTNCPICGQDKPPQPQQPPPQPQPQQQMGFPQMGMAQYPGGCGGGGCCNYVMPQQMMQGGCCGGKPARPGDWHCSNSACKNFRDNLVFGSKSSCPICGTPKPANAGMGGGGGFPMTHQVAPMMMMQGCMGGMGGMGGMGSMAGGMTPRGKRGQPGDWNCPNSACKNHRDNFVYASKSECPICHTPKPLDAGVATTMRPGDWKCPNISCKNHINGVYGSKPMCTICGEANPNARERSRSPRRM